MDNACSVFLKGHAVFTVVLVSSGAYRVAPGSAFFLTRDMADSWSYCSSEGTQSLDSPWEN